MPRLRFAVAVVLVAVGCSPPKKPAAVVPAGPTPAQRLTAADALLRTGCFDCLRDALKEYEAARTASAPGTPVLEEATVGAARAAILLDLREREIGTLNDRYLTKARELLSGRADFDVWAPALDLTEAMAWRFSDAREVNDEANLIAIRRMTQNREAWKTLFRERAGEHPFWGYLWLAFACQTGETRSLTPEAMAAPLGAGADAGLLAYKTAACPATKDVPPQRSAIDVKTLATIQQNEPRFHEIDYTVALSLTFGGRVEEARELLDRAFRWHPKWPAVTMALAGLALTVEDFERALAFYDTTLDLVPGHPPAMLGRVKTLSYVGRNEDAIKVADEILQGQWNRGEAFYWRAWNHMQLERNDQAWDDVEAAWRLWINSDVAKLAGMVAYRRKQIDVARGKFEEGHRMNADDCELGYYLGLVNAEQGRWPPTSEVFLTTAVCLVEAQKKYTREISQIQGSTGSEERKARQIARREKLIRDAERMIATSYYNIAVASFNLSQKDQAREYAQKVVEDQQFGERAREILSRLK